LSRTQALPRGSLILSGRNWPGVHPPNASRPATHFCRIALLSRSGLGGCGSFARCRPSGLLISNVHHRRSGDRELYPAISRDQPFGYFQAAPGFIGYRQYWQPDNRTAQEVFSERRNQQAGQFVAPPRRVTTPPQRLQRFGQWKPQNPNTLPGVPRLPPNEAAKSRLCPRV